MRHVAEKHTMVLEALYAMVGWPLYKKYGHAYDACKLCLTDQEDIFSGLEAFAPGAIDEDVKATLIQYIKSRLAPQPVKARRAAPRPHAPPRAARRYRRAGRSSLFPRRSRASTRASAPLATPRSAARTSR